MNRKFQEEALVLATHNSGKIEEFKHLFGEVSFNITDIGQYHWQPPEETGGSFWEKIKHFPDIQETLDDMVVAYLDEDLQALMDASTNFVDKNNSVMNKHL